MLGIVLTLDPEVCVQNAVASAKLCAVMAKESEAILEMDWCGKGLEFKCRHKGSSNFQRYKLPAFSVSDFPACETPPSAMNYVRAWNAVRAVVHAASGPKIDDQIFRCVRFTPRCVEATDRYRVARAEIDEEWEGLVPSEVFQHWPAGDVFAKFTALHAFFRIGDEVRYAALVHGKFPDTRVYVPDEHHGNFALCELAPLLGAVKQASKMT